MKKGSYYLHLDKFSLVYSYYAYFDVPEYFADQLFIQHQIRVHFSGEYKKAGKRYVIVLCRVRKKYERRFLDALSELPKKMLLLGYTDYLEDCAELVERMEARRQNIRSA